MAIVDRGIPNNRVILVEDHATVREAVAQILTSDEAFVLAGAFGTIRTTLAALDQGVEADIALVDLGLPDGSGIGLIRTLRRSYPGMVVVAFTALDDGDIVFEALRAGARGYLLKSTTPARLPHALDEALAGGAPMSPSVARRVVEALFVGAQTSDELSYERAAVGRLTAREHEVLLLVAKGATYPEIARLLHLALGTVQGYVREVYAKLEVTSKAEAAMIATRLGLL